MPVPSSGPLHAYLTGDGRDSRGRCAGDVLLLPDETLEEVHDYIQWLFPLPTRSIAQPNAPVLTKAEIDAIKVDPRAVETLRRAAERMLQFYSRTRWWLTGQDHNHLRITRIIRSLRLLVGPDTAQAFHRDILTLHDRAGAPVNPRSLQFWAEAAHD
ncbi:opioid growth factor receptor-related protein [Microvirga sp. TS319]|uniref:opioid growth factor receptor-related protein n=1 Tax=Microvirga sp. TS319 TaxID=3241165 RepID=UPI00351A654B